MEENAITKALERKKALDYQRILELVYRDIENDDTFDDTIIRKRTNNPDDNNGAVLGNDIFDMTENYHFYITNVPEEEIMEYYRQFICDDDINARKKSLTTVSWVIYACSLIGWFVCAIICSTDEYASHISWIFFGVFLVLSILYLPIPLLHSRIEGIYNKLIEINKKTK